MASLPPSISSHASRLYYERKRILATRGRWSLGLAAQGRPSWLASSSRGGMPRMAVGTGWGNTAVGWFGGVG